MCYALGVKIRNQTLMRGMTSNENQKSPYSPTQQPQISQRGILVGMPLENYTLRTGI